MKKFKVFKSLLKQGFSKINIIRNNLSGANLSRSDLSGANLSMSNLSWSDLSMSNLFWSNLSGANLSGANLSRSNLSGANLSGANLSGANLSGANLSGARLDKCIFNELTFGLTINCPEKGSFTAFKKAKNMIIELFIPVSAKRSSATSYKCRCNKAKVISIENIDGTKSELTEIVSDYDSTFIYKIGKIVKVSDFDNNRWIECSSGIHFFMNRKMAENYR
jgi:uncharacterized protein YjbI with pentapeptide repeats